MLSILPLGWVVISLPEDTPIFYFWLYIHEGVGIGIFFLTAFRIAWRFHDEPPSLPPFVKSWNRRTASLVSMALLVAMVVLPVSGYLWSNGHGNDVIPFNLVPFPRIAFNQTYIGDIAKAIHQYGQWVVYALIAAHLLGVSYHIIVARDGLLGRMLPPNAFDPQPAVSDCSSLPAPHRQSPPT